VADTRAASDLRTDYLHLLKHAVTGLLEATPMTTRIEKGGTLKPVPLRRVEKRLEGRDWPPNAVTMVGMKRLDNVQACIEGALADDVPGDLLEAGVWRGGTSIFMRGVLKAHGVTDRKVVVADSFEGLPAPDTEQFPADAKSKLHRHDFLAVPQETVAEHFRRFGLLDDQVEFVKGWFRDTMPALAGRTWAVLRLDGDMYESTTNVLENLYPGLSPGGFVIIDDFHSLPHCRRAVRDYREAHGIEDEMHQIDWTGAYWRKG
jgi:hypothetical protein